tara:strand:- start:9676 stop:11718 length:2043 start_codon:yes stop_codon:yes gene_type:complete
MNKSNAGFLAFLGFAVAAAIGAFFVAPKIFKTGGETATQSGPASSLAEGDATQPQSAQPETPITEVASAEPVEPVGADAWIAPSFDVLRVEPDGSTVIAGKAEPGTTLNIMNGESVIASTQVGPSGDFVAVLDTPLAAGDYQLTLQIVGEGGETRLSEEIATVAVPKDASGELLAMVSKPGKASRIIAQPEAAASSEPVETASAAPESVPGETVSPAQQNAGGEVASETQTGTEAAADAADAGSAASPAIQTPALPDASSLLTTSAPEAGAENAPAAEVAASDQTAPVAGAANEDGPTADASRTELDVAQPEAAAEIAMAAPGAAADPASSVLSADAKVRVDAVEIEGGRIFIAGSATPGYSVRVSADGVVIGTAQADETGRFIIEATTELSVGDHIINADLMEPGGQETVLRATVPFNRPEGDTLAAVSPSEGASGGSDSGKSAAPQGLILPDIAGLSKMREESFEALSRLGQMVSAPETAETNAVTGAYEDAVAKLKAAATADLPAGSSDDAMAMAQSMRAQAEAALTVINPPVAEGADQSSTPNDVDLIADPARMREMLKDAETALSRPASITVAAANAPEPAAASGGTKDEPRTIVQAPLASTPGAVIIRRGDTLWQISRRTYGQGVRYTTIYVANRSQIQDPDRIKPGQVFSVPESPLDNAEALHQQLLDGSKRP